MIEANYIAQDQDCRGYSVNKVFVADAVIGLEKTWKFSVVSMGILKTLTLTGDRAVFPA